MALLGLGSGRSPPGCGLPGDILSRTDPCRQMPKMWSNIATCLAGRKCYRLLTVPASSSRSPQQLRHVYKLSLSDPLTEFPDRASLMAPGHACSLLPPRHGLCRYLPRGCGFLCFSAFSSSAFSSSAAVGSRVFPDTGPWVLLLRVKLGRCRSLTASALRVSLTLGPAVE